LTADQRADDALAALPDVRQCRKPGYEGSPPGPSFSAFWLSGPQIHHSERTVATPVGRHRLHPGM
jgi:hypothetical protein